MSDGARLPRLGLEDVSGTGRRLFDAFLRECGNVPNLLHAAAHRPPIVDMLFALMGAVIGRGAVDLCLNELLAIRVSHINGCSY